MLTKLLVASGSLLLGGLASAQWSDDALVNLAVADAASDQSQPKVVPTTDGGCYLSWFDGIGSGWDVRLQRLDIGGEEVFPHAGVLVADRSFSSTQDYGLATDASGNALLAYRDDGGVGVQITASKIAPDGTPLWSTTLTSTTAFVAAPKIAATSSGTLFVAWTQDSSVRLRRLDADGTPLGSETVLTPGVGSHSVSDMHGSADAVILSVVHQSGGFGSSRRLRAQKYSAAGAPLWGVELLPIFDAGSLQFGNFPSFEEDGLGGAVFSWYDTSTLQLQVFAQHITAAGAESFAHNGVPGSTNAARVRVGPDVIHDAATGETYMFWTEQSSSQAESGVYGQKFNASGVRQWTNDGLQLVPLGSPAISGVSLVASGSNVLVCWDRSLGFGNDMIHGALIDSTGSVDTGPFDVSSLAASKSRLALSSSSSGQAILAWQDDRTDAGDVYAQNINEDGSLGPRWTDVGGGTSGINGAPRLTAFGPLTDSSIFGLSLVNGPPSAITLLWASLTSTPLNVVGGTIYAFPVDIKLILFTNAAGSVGGATIFPPGAASGANLWFQFLLQDTSTLFGVTLSNALKATTP